tara:strand:+ start:1868 stop:2068 length:201 start_codon:yes stop_codon:yes gene_type:complete
MKQDNFPIVSTDVIKALEEAFPKRDFGPNKPLRELDYHFGQRSVIRFLQSKAEEQRENSLISIPNN